MVRIVPDMLANPPREVFAGFAMGTRAQMRDLQDALRRELRQQKLWALSDRIRANLAELGVLLEDSKDGTTWRRKL